MGRGGKGKRGGWKPGRQKDRDTHKKGNGWQQDITGKEHLWNVLGATGITSVTAWLYYRSFWMMIPLLPVLLWHLHMMEEESARKKEAEFQLQFKEAVLSVSAALNTGYSVENAFYEAQKELVRIYPEERRIMKELKIITRQLRMNVPMEQVLEEFGQRAANGDVRNFAAVFVAAKKSGGNMIAIIQDTVRQMGDKIDVKREIDTILAAKRYEFRVMSAVPYAIIGYMSLSFPEFMDSLYGNALGIGVMTVCLIIYMGAYYLGIRMIRIEV
ncbi:MAG: type II secretion system F family protein [Lachnospiraceae bacterium]